MVSSRYERIEFSEENAFSCLQEALSCVVSRFDNTYFVIVVKLK